MSLYKTSGSIIIVIIIIIAACIAVLVVDSSPPAVWAPLGGDAAQWLAERGRARPAISRTVLQPASSPHTLPHPVCASRTGERHSLTRARFPALRTAVLFIIVTVIMCYVWIYALF